MSSRSSSRASSAAGSGKRGGKKAGSTGSKRSSVTSDVGAMTLLEKRMLEKKGGMYLLETDIRNIFNQVLQPQDLDSNPQIANPGPHTVMITHVSRAA
mmetsp:Transcript_16484/g.25596  ORF Transcript_16484/g.25596 Transcript_16484/m.25596 type:complete len:98 (+) Transcript_16484:213-506(+)